MTTIEKNAWDSEYLILDSRIRHLSDHIRSPWLRWGQKRQLKRLYRRMQNRMLVHLLMKYDTSPDSEREDT